VGEKERDESLGENKERMDNAKVKEKTKGAANSLCFLKRKMFHETRKNAKKVHESIEVDYDKKYHSIVSYTYHKKEKRIQKNETQKSARNDECLHRRKRVRSKKAEKEREAT